MALLALFALVLRLSAAMAVPVPAELTLDVLLGSGICHADPGAPTDAPADPAHAHDCVLCPACLGVVTGLPGASAAVVTAPIGVETRFLLPPAGAGPPARAFATAQPRAPPRFV
jgi:hypothetical protein